MIVFQPIYFCDQITGNFGINNDDNNIKAVILGFHSNKRSKIY